MTTGEPMVTIDATSQVAPFEQVRQQIADAIEVGALPPGTKLPTVRGLATELGVAPNTIARSYRELETSGHVNTRGRKGTIVAERTIDADAERLALNYLAAMHERGHDAAAALRYVERAIGSLE